MTAGQPWLFCTALGGVDARESAGTEVKPDPVRPRARHGVELDSRVDDARTNLGENLRGIPLPRGQLRPQVLDENVGVSHQRIDGFAVVRLTGVEDRLSDVDIRLDTRL